MEIIFLHPYVWLGVSFDALVGGDSLFPLDWWLTYWWSYYTLVYIWWDGHLGLWSALYRILCLVVMVFWLFEHIVWAWFDLVWDYLLECPSLYGCYWHMVWVIMSWRTTFFRELPFIGTYVEVCLHLLLVWGVVPLLHVVGWVIWWPCTWFYLWSGPLTHASMLLAHILRSPYVGVVAITTSRTLLAHIHEIQFGRGI